MASIVNQMGTQADVGRKPDQSDEALGKIRSVVILGLRTQGYDYWAIAKVLKLSDRHVSRLYNAVPADPRDFYAMSAAR